MDNEFSIRIEGRTYIADIASGHDGMIGLPYRIVGSRLIMKENQQCGVADIDLLFGPDSLDKVVNSRVWNPNRWVRSPVNPDRIEFSSLSTEGDEGAKFFPAALHWMKVHEADIIRAIDAMDAANAAYKPARKARAKAASPK